MKDSTLKIEPLIPLKPGEYMTGFNTRVSIGGLEVKGVAAIDVQYRPDSMVTAVLTLHQFQHTVDGLKALLEVEDPVTGVVSRIKKLEFQDGQVFEFTE